MPPNLKKCRGKHTFSASKCSRQKLKRRRLDVGRYSVHDMSLHTHAWAYPERCVLLLKVKFNFLFNFPNTDQISIAYGTTI